MLDAEAGGGVDKVWCDLRKRLEDKAAEVHFGVRKGEARCLEDDVVVEEKIEVEGAGTFEQAKGAVAAKVLFDEEEGVEQVDG